MMAHMMAHRIGAVRAWRARVWRALFGRALAGGLLVGAALVGAAAAQEATEPTRLGIYKNWTAYASGNGISRECFIVSQPQTLLPQGALRGDVFLSVSHRPTDGVRNEIGLRIGYPFADTSRPYATIGERRFQFFSGASLQNGVKEWAWLQDNNQHEALVRAMKRGARLSFRGTSQRGTLTTDTYSLLGFTAAMKAIDTACP